MGGVRQNKSSKKHYRNVTLSSQYSLIYISLFLYLRNLAVFQSVIFVHKATKQTPYFIKISVIHETIKIIINTRMKYKVNYSQAKQK